LSLRRSLRGDYESPPQFIFRRLAESGTLRVSWYLARSIAPYNRNHRLIFYDGASYHFSELPKYTGAGELSLPSIFELKDFPHVALFYAHR
jgi:hypothetical protein